MSLVAFALQFAHPRLSSSPLQSFGCAVQSYGPVTIENTCFLDNEFSKYAPVVLLGGTAVFTASENYGNVFGDENLECDFAISFKNIQDFGEVTNFTCTEFDAPECTKTITTAPAEFVEPTMAPSRGSNIVPETETPQPSGSPVAATDSPGDGAAGKVIIRRSAAAAALTAYFLF
jgi:hypothetical protein